MTINISNITYGDTMIRGKIEPDTGILKSFKEEISYAGRVPVGITVTVNLSKWTGMCSSLEYGVEVGGRTQVSPKYDIFDERKLPRTVAFSPEEPTGVIIGGGGPLEKDLVTEFGYDDKNRRQTRRQTFGTGGVTYEVSYSDYVYKGPPTGKMSSFAARITTVAK